MGSHKRRPCANAINRAARLCTHLISSSGGVKKDGKDEHGSLKGSASRAATMQRRWLCPAERAPAGPAGPVPVEPAARVSAAALAGIATDNVVTMASHSPAPQKPAVGAPAGGLLEPPATSGRCREGSKGVLKRCSSSFA